MERTIILKDNELNIILQALSAISVPIREAHIVLSLMENIQTQIKEEKKQ
jgi:hypothetical protein